MTIKSLKSVILSDRFIHILIPLFMASSSNTVCHADPRSVKKCWKIGHPHHKKKSHLQVIFLFLLKQCGRLIVKKYF